MDWASAKGSGAQAGAEALRWLLQPYPLKRFFDDYYESRWLHVTDRPDDYYASLFATEDLDNLLWQYRDDPDLVKASQAGTAESPPHVVFTDEREWWPGRKYGSGHTLIVNGLERRNLAVARFVREVEHFFFAHAHVNLYLTPPNQRGFPPHFDRHDTLIMQIAGRKRWTIRDAAAHLPVHNQLDDPLCNDASGEPHVFEMRPGDLLYIPRGIVHSAEANDEPTMHLTLGLHPRLWLDLMYQAVAIFVEQDDEARRSVPFDDADDNCDRRFAELAERFAGRARDPEFADMVKRRTKARALEQLGALPNGQLARFDEDIELSADDQLERRPDALCVAFRYAGRAHIRFTGMVVPGTIAAPPFAYEALCFVEANPGPFPVSALPDSLSESGKLVLARRLIREGLLRRA